LAPTNLETKQIAAALKAVRDPSVGREINVKSIDILPAGVRVSVTLTTPANPARDRIVEDVRAAVRRLDPAAAVEVELGFAAPKARGLTILGGGGGDTEDLIPGVRNAILIASGKGGVGKSTVATNVACALASAGARTGLMDADIYGPSLPTMLGVNDRPGSVDGKTLEPVPARGHDGATLHTMSIGYLVDTSTAMIWRGPMVHGAILQFLRDVNWGELDYLIVDLPPGTGDVQLTLAQKIKPVGAVLVSTPQDVALADVVRGKAMFDKVDIPTLGVVENMSYFVCPDCTSRHEIFAHGGAARLSRELKIPFLGAIPIEVGVRAAGDAGEPVVWRDPGSPAARAFFALAEHLAAAVSVRRQGGELGPLPDVLAAAASQRGAR
jgi:ATP-binding protein involved in chromosome partitioning